MKNFLNVTALTLALFLGATEPVFYIPMDNSPDVMGEGGRKITAGIIHGRSGYLPGVAGKALDVRRHAYDQVTAAIFEKMPAVNCSNGTVSFWFKPHWNETDAVEHTIFSARDSQWKGFRFYLLKNRDFIELSVCSPDQVQIIGKDLLKAEKWTHIAFSWEQENSRVRLFVNGRKVGEKATPGAFKQFSPMEVNYYLGQEGFDRFKTVVGDGFYDEIKIFDKPLSAAEVFVLASDGAQEKLAAMPLDTATRHGTDISFTLKNRDGRLTGAKKLLILNAAEPGKKLTLSAMGASGKLSVIVEDGSAARTLESACPLQLDEPHKIDVRQAGNRLDFLIDGVVQGSVELGTPFGKIVSAEGAEGVSLLPADTVPSQEQTARLTDVSVRPVEEPFWSLDDAQRSENGVRRGVCLNGYWRVFPVNDFTYAPPAGDWGYMRVPGSFRSPLYRLYRDNNGKLEPTAWTWHGQELSNYRSSWYQRVFQIPDDLRKEGRIYLNFTNLNGDSGLVYLNGKLIGSFRQDFKTFTVIPNQLRIDVTDDVSLKSRNVLTLFVDRPCVNLWEGQPSIGDHNEIALDNIWLESAPEKVALKTAVALPSFRRQELSMRVRIQNPAGEKGDAVVRFDFRRDGSGQSFSKDIVLDGSPEQVETFTESWKNPVLWDVENPNLYRMSVSLLRNDREADTLPAKDFGFREAWVENGGFRMNGQKMRMRMWSSPGLLRVRYYYGSPKAVGQFVAHIRELNYDTVRFDPYVKESQVCWEDYLNASNRQGLYNLFQMPHYEDEDMGIYTAEVTRFLEHYGTHPSILMWYTDFNTCSYPWNQDPAKLNDTDYVPGSTLNARRRAQTAEKVMRSLDPSRELFQHAGGNSGKIFTSMNYQSFGTPLQEQEDWPKQWSMKHTQPLMVVESAFPYPAQFQHFDNPAAGLLGAEHAARYFGDAVFSREARPIPNAGEWLNSPYANPNANIYGLSAMLYRRVVKAWRAYDVSALGDFPGARDMARTARTYDAHNAVYEVDDNVKSAGLKPDAPDGGHEVQRHLLTDYSQPEGLHEVIRNSFSPLLVFLGGMPEDFTNKDHAFFAGEKFRKSAIVVNDHTTAQKVTCRWELVVDSRLVQHGEMTETAVPGAILKLPIDLIAPEVVERTGAELRLTALKDGVLIQKDTFALQFFPKYTPRNFRDIIAGLYDPEGRTEAVLKQAGFPFRKVETLEDAKQCRLLIIGRNALKSATPELLKQIEKAGLIESGLKVLIFEQQPCNLANFVFESPSHRNAFLRRPESPYVAGLKDEDFSNWRGSSDSVPAFVLSEENSPHYPRSKWKCGNGGIVSGNVIRKPSYGNFKTIVDSGFNLMFASLLELRKGHGIVLFCQLDVTSRYRKDPVATQLVDNMLSEMGKRFVPVGPQRAAYLGDAGNEAILKRMGMCYEKLDTGSLWKISDAQVLLLGADPVPAAKAGELKKLLSESNVTVVALPGAPLELLPGGMKRGEKELFRASAPKNDPLFAGVTDADLYYREARMLPVLVSAPDWVVATSPALFAKLDRITTATVVLNLSPEAIDGPWNQEKTARVWSTIFDNMNLGLGRDLVLFTASRSRHNTVDFRFGETEPENCGIRFDPNEEGKPSDTENFTPIQLGTSWESQGHQQENPHYRYPVDTQESQKLPYDGFAWYRCTVKIPESWKGHAIRLIGGPIDDCDWTWWNGTEIGKTTLANNPNSYSARRDYPIPEELVKFGQENTLMIKVFDRWGEGGVLGRLKVVAEERDSKPSWSPYVDALDFYDVDAFHNW